MYLTGCARDSCPFITRNVDVADPADACPSPRSGCSGRAKGLAAVCYQYNRFCVGAFFAGVFFIRTYGVFHTALIAAVINAAICLVALTQPRCQVRQQDPHKIFHKNKQRRPVHLQRHGNSSFFLSDWIYVFSSPDHLGSNPDLRGVKQYLFFLDCFG